MQQVTLTYRELQAIMEYGSPHTHPEQLITIKQYADGRIVFAKDGLAACEYEISDEELSGDA